MWTDNDFGDPRADDMTELTQRLMRCATLIEQADGVLNAHQMQRLDGCMGDV